MLQCWFGNPFVTLGLGHFLGPYLRLTLCLTLRRPGRAQGQLWTTELQSTARELDPGATDELSDPSWWKHFPELCGCLFLTSQGLEDRQELNYPGMGELPESPSWIVMQGASQPGEKLPSSQIQRDTESLLFWRQRNERVWLHKEPSLMIKSLQGRSGLLLCRGKECEPHNTMITQHPKSSPHFLQPPEVFYFFCTLLIDWESEAQHLPPRLLGWFIADTRENSTSPALPLHVPIPLNYCLRCWDKLSSLVVQKRNFLPTSYSWSCLAFLSHFIWSWLGTNKGEVTALSSSWEKESWISCRGEVIFCFHRTSVGKQIRILP